MGQTHAGRLLPWTGPEGKPCYLVGDGRGYLSRVADNVEDVQLGMGADLLDHVAEVLGDERATVVELRFIAARLTEALSDALRVAESRGERLPAPEYDGPGETDGDDGPALSAEAFG
ncbi:hypothetical protein NLX86_20690 [Streptomyces sp. A3M-1-3]|uniref:hypothetical protein n=1 Tax=Streptomyces sp. A3M-1-3 TaxID=2962044 RepID=UPI0020B8287A|nr:hypothetical protein [Streptomyces sp. A3M-1-3]MCP3820425.1 hypothetical protein [Streptomyces sp. A3M-1-3]